MHKLIQALPERSHLLIVGDVDQLPSVGPGSALADILRSEVVPAVRLREIFRQAASSRIVIHAHRIRWARSGKAWISLCIRGTSIIEVSSATSTSHSKGCAAFRAKPPEAGWNSS